MRAYHGIYCLSIACCSSVQKERQHIGNALILCVKDQFCRLRWFVGGIKSGNAADLAVTSPRIQTFWISAHALSKRCGKVNFDKAASRKQRTNAVTISRKRRNKGTRNVQPGIEHDPGNLTGTTDVFATVGIRHSQISAQSTSQLITIQHESRLIITLQCRTQGARQCCFSGSRQAGKPPNAVQHVKFISAPSEPISGNGAQANTPCHCGTDSAFCLPAIP